MVQGIIDNKNRPIIDLVVANTDAQNVQDLNVLVDSGFTGDLKVSNKTANDLRLKITGVESVQIANGQLIDMTTALAYVLIENTLKAVDVLISEGSQALGIGNLNIILI